MGSNQAAGAIKRHKGRTSGQKIAELHRREDLFEEIIYGADTEGGRLTKTIRRSTDGKKTV